jgi:hypothetical protein
MAINPAATVDTANGIAKRVHGDIRDMVPKKNLRVLKRIKYDDKTKLGGEFAELVYLTGEHGFTYGGSSGAKRTLNSSEVAESQLAKATPNEIDFRSEVVITLMSRAREGGEKAFESYISAMMRNARKAFDKRLEIAMNYGGAPLASALTVSAPTTTTLLFTCTVNTWAPHIWLNQRNCSIDAYNGATQLNTRADLNVSTVNVGRNSRQILFTGNADDITAIVAAGTATDLYFKGAKGLDGTGLRSIGNLTTGLYLNINAATYPDVWNGTKITWDYSAADFTWGTLQDGLEDAASKGMEGDVIVQVPFPVWQTLNNSLDALRVLDSSFSVNKAEMGRGVDSITYHAITGSATIEASGFQRYGEVMAYLDPAEEGFPKRIGSSNVTFNVPGRGDEMFRLTENANTVEYRAFTDQMLWLPAPRNVVLWAA